MFRALFRLVLLVVIVVAGAAFFLGWWSFDTLRDRTGMGDRPLTGQIDTSKAREVGAKVGEKTAVAAGEAQAALAQGTLTAKIKSKMALDDLVRARSINVDTSGGVATLTGTVSSEAERQRALQLARETNGVTSVVDRLVVR